MIPHCGDGAGCAGGAISAPPNALACQNLGKISKN